MTIETKISLNMTTNQAPVVVDVVQGEQMTRVVSAALYDGAQTWSIPGDVKVGVAFRKPDGTGGLYDELPNKKPAVTVSGSTVKATLAPQVQSVAGDVAAAIVFMVPSTMERLATFPFILRVAKDPSTGSPASNNYYKYSTLEEINNAISGLEDDVAGIIDDNAINNKSAWSSKKIIDTLCPPFDITGSVVICDPVLGYPLSVQSKIIPIQSGSNLPSPTNVRPIIAPSAVQLTQEAGETRNYIADLPKGFYGGVLDWNGNLTKTWYEAEYDGSADENWYVIEASAGYNIFRLNGVPDVTRATNRCNIFADNVGGWANMPNLSFIAVSGVVGFRIDSCKTVEEFRAFLQKNPVQWVSEMKNPERPKPIAVSGEPTALPGTNIFSSDTGDTTVSGREYPYAKIARQQAEIDDLRKAIISTGGNV